MTAFALGLVWFFCLSMQTRLVAHGNRWWFHASWTTLTSLVWVFLVRELTLTTDAGTAVFYALGTGVGSVLATAAHARHAGKDNPP